MMKGRKAALRTAYLNIHTFHAAQRTILVLVTHSVELARRFGVRFALSLLLDQDRPLP